MNSKGLLTTDEYLYLCHNLKDYDIPECVDYCVDSFVVKGEELTDFSWFKNKVNEYKLKCLLASNS